MTEYEVLMGNNILDPQDTDFIVFSELTRDETMQLFKLAEKQKKEILIRFNDVKEVEVEE